jgi:hypothetical protein
LLSFRHPDDSTAANHRIFSCPPPDRRIVVVVIVDSLLNSFETSCSVLLLIDANMHLLPKIRVTRAMRNIYIFNQPMLRSTDTFPECSSSREVDYKFKQIVLLFFSSVPYTRAATLLIQNHVVCLFLKRN